MSLFLFNGRDSEDDETLFTDREYLYQAMKYFNRYEDRPVEPLQRVRGLDIMLTDDIRRRMQDLLPAEVVALLKKKSYLRMVSEKDYCMHVVRANTHTDVQKA